MTNDELYALTKIDPWFLEQVRDIITFEKRLATERAHQEDKSLSPELLCQAKTLGFSE